MTERTGRFPRWSVVAFVAPATAALFTGTMHWAAGHSPTTATVSVPVAVSDPAPTAQRPDPRIQREARRVDRLRRQVKALHRQVAALKNEDRETTTGTAARTPSRTSAKSPARPKSKTQPAPVAAAPAPATDTSTGAS